MIQISNAPRQSNAKFPLKLILAFSNRQFRNVQDSLLAMRLTL